MGNLWCGSKSTEKEDTERTCEIENRKVSETARELRALIQRGAIEDLKRRLSQFSVHRRKEIVDYAEDNFTCLSVAVQEENFNIAKYLLNTCKANPDILVSQKENSEKVTLLTSTICLEQSEFVSLLLKYGAKVNFKGNQDQYPLHYACQTGNDYITSLLIKAGADVNVENEDGLTPIEMAALFCINRDIRFLEMSPIGRLLSADEVRTQSKINALEILAIASAYAYFKHDKQQLRKMGVANPIYILGDKVTLQITQESSASSEFDSSLFKHSSFINCNNDLERIQLFGEISLFFKHLIIQCERVLGLSDKRTIFLYKQWTKCHFEKSSAGLSISGDYHRIKEEEEFPTLLCSSDFIARNCINFDKVWLEDFYSAVAYWSGVDRYVIKKHYDAVLLFCYTFMENMTAYFVKHVSTNTRVGWSVFESVVRLLSCVIELDKDVWEPVFSPVITTIIERDLTCDNEHESLLHIALTLYLENDHEEHVQNGSMVIEHLINAGMSVNKTDLHGNTSLIHYLKRSKNYFSWNLETGRFCKVFDLLLEHSHLDIRNKKGESALSLLKGIDYDICAVKYRSLQCLAAEEINRHRDDIILKQHSIPAYLLQFIGEH